jgi:hypothetical protein
MLKNISKLSVTVVTVLTLFSGQAFAETATQVKLNAAYPKGAAGYDVVVKGSPGAKLMLYVNDKTAYKATVNKSSWATFHKVKLSDKNKLSFTKVVSSKKGSTFQQRLNYVQFASVAGQHASFAANLPKTPTPVPTPVPMPVPTPAPTPTPAASNTGVNDPNLSNSNTYTNSQGATVHSPADSTDGPIPAGATAQCSDGTYSFSQSRSGTCSHHGGVGSWL